VSVDRRRLLALTGAAGVAAVQQQPATAGTANYRFVRKFWNVEDVEEYLNGVAARHQIISVSFGGGDYSKGIVVVTEGARSD